MFQKLLKWLSDHKIPVRLIVSVIAGIATAMVLSVLTHELLYLAGIFPPLQKPMFDTRLVLIELLYHSVYAVAGAMVTAMIAREKAAKAVIIFGTKEAVMWIIGMLLLWKHTPPWYNLTKAILGVPIAMLGGRLYAWLKQKREQKQKQQSPVRL